MSPEATEIQAWFDSERGRGCADGSAFGLSPANEQYLRNRLWHALTAGIAIGRRLTISELPADATRFDGLTIQESIDVLVMQTMERFSHKSEVARHLGISLKTLYNRLHRIESKKAFRRTPGEART